MMIQTKVGLYKYKRMSNFHLLLGKCGECSEYENKVWDAINIFRYCIAHTFMDETSHFVFILHKRTTYATKMMHQVCVSIVYVYLLRLKYWRKDQTEKYNGRMQFRPNVQ